MNHSGVSTTTAPRPAVLRISGGFIIDLGNRDDAPKRAAR